jgi:hypothetical protein
VAGEPRDGAVALGDEQAMTPARPELVEPPSTALHGPRLDVERDRGLADVVVVDVVDGGEICCGGGTDEVRHAARFYIAAGQARACA